MAAATARTEAARAAPAPAAAHQPASPAAASRARRVAPTGAPFVRLDTGRTTPTGMIPTTATPPTGTIAARTIPPGKRPAGEAPAVRAALAHDVGAPLSLAVRGPLERSLGIDLETVRVHQGSGTTPLVDGVGARAFAFGTHVFLGAGERASDLGLMAHEVAHVVQQQGAPTLQRLGGPASDVLEREAEQASAAVVGGRPARVDGRAAPQPQFQFGFLRRAASAVARGVSAAVSTVGAAVADVGGVALRFIRDRVNNIPGYSMLAFVLGRDPITQQPVERNAVNLIRALMGLWTGGELIFQALQRYGIVDRVGAWLTDQLRTLGLAAGAIRDALDRFLRTVRPQDILDLGGVWERARRIFSEPVERVSSFVRWLAAGVLGFVREAVLRPLARLAQPTRGYDLLRLVLNQDPITGEPYPRTPENVIGGFMRLIGQEEKWRHLQQSRAIPRAWAWFQAQFGTLTGFVREVPGLFRQAWQSLQIGDLLDPAGAFNRMRGIFGGFVSRFVTWAGDAALQVMMFVVEALAPEAMPVLRRAAAVIRTIVSDPVRFVGNLVRAGLRGFEQFRDRIGTHLISGLVGWLTGALAGAGLQLPQRWDLRGILSLVLQILGLTWQNVRQKLVRHIPEPVLGALEATFNIVVTLRREGPAAAWQQIVEQLGNLQEMVFGQIRAWVERTIVGQAVVRILSMLNPAGAVIQAIMAIASTIQFFRTRFQQIAQVTEAFFNSVAEIAGGNISSAATRVEQTMARLVPVVIGLFAELIGLGGITATIRDIIARIRAPIDRALDRVVDWIVAQARRLGRLVAGGVSAAVGAVSRWWQRRREFDAGGERHAVYFSGQEGRAEIMVASRPLTWPAFVAGLASYPSPTGVAARTDAIAAANTLRATMQRSAATFAPPVTKDVAVERDLNALAAAVGRLLRLSPAGANRYPGSGLDPRARTTVQLWADILPAPITGYAESPRDIEFRRVMARGCLLERGCLPPSVGYSAAQLPTAQGMMNFNLGRQIKAFNLDQNEAEDARAHTRRRHVLNGSGEIKDRRDLALRVLLDLPPTNGTFTAGAYTSITAAQAAVRAGINTAMAAAGGWPAFRDVIIRTTGNASAITGNVAAGATGFIYRSGGTVPHTTLPTYLNGYAFNGVTISGAAGTNPLYPGDPNPGLVGPPLVTPLAASGSVRIALLTLPTARQGWFVLTSFPTP